MIPVNGHSNVLQVILKNICNMKYYDLQPAFRAWERLTLAQIASGENAIKCLTAEINATRELVKQQKHTLKMGRKDQEKYEK